MVTFLALWVPSDKNKQKSWPCMRSRPAGVNRFDQILDISKHLLCRIVSDNNMIHCIHYGISLQSSMIVAISWKYIFLKNNTVSSYIILAIQILNQRRYPTKRQERLVLGRSILSKQCWRKNRWEDLTKINSIWLNGKDDHGDSVGTPIEAICTLICNV